MSLHHVTPWHDSRIHRIAIHHRNHQNKHRHAYFPADHIVNMFKPPLSIGLSILSDQCWLDQPTCLHYAFWLDVTSDAPWKRSFCLVFTGFVSMSSGGSFWSCPSAADWILAVHHPLPTPIENKDTTAYLTSSQSQSSVHFDWHVCYIWGLVTVNVRLVLV